MGNVERPGFSLSQFDFASADADGERPRSDARQRRSEITLHQLRVFWAVAHSDTLTKAAKQLGLAQPSLSQQLSKLETTLGTQLFHRRSNEMVLTEAGAYLLPKAEHMLRGMRELEDGLLPFTDGRRVTVRLAGITSVLRTIVPQAIRTMEDKFPDAEFDIQESSPADVLEMLYGRRISLGLLAASSVAQASVGFVQIPVIDDPYVLVVPEQLKLDGITDPERQLSADDFSLLNRSIRFIFGTQHARRVDDWYDEMLPSHRVAAQCRSFELAVDLVRAGTGICLAPALSTMTGAGAPAGVRLYRLNTAPRRVVALIPTPYRQLEPYATLLDAIRQIGASTVLPPIADTPAFLDRPSTVDL